eukprot:1132319-Amphidinium_carterae.1
MAGWAWHCTTCECYNFGYRTSCFRCSEPRGNAKLFKTPGPARKSGSPAPNTPKQQASNQKSGQPAGGTNKPGEAASMQGRATAKQNDRTNSAQADQGFKEAKDDLVLRELESIW